MKMKTILLLARRRQRSIAAATSHTRGDRFPVFTPREWADLPVHHPAAD